MAARTCAPEGRWRWAAHAGLRQQLRVHPRLVTLITLMMPLIRIYLRQQLRVHPRLVARAATVGGEARVDHEAGGEHAILHPSHEELPIRQVPPQ
eukprot:6883653-Prymnesium_polylepis.1